MAGFESSDIELTINGNTYPFGKITSDVESDKWKEFLSGCGKSITVTVSFDNRNLFTLRHLLYHGGKNRLPRGYRRFT